MIAKEWEQPLIYFLRSSTAMEGMPPMAGKVYISTAIPKHRP
jgi:hypothetical protein